MKNTGLLLILMIPGILSYSQIQQYGNNAINKQYNTNSHGSTANYIQNHIQHIRNLTTDITEKGDTMWLYTRTERHIMENENLVFKYLGVLNYYMNPEENGYGLVKEYISLDPLTNDSVYCMSFSYDEHQRQHEIIMQYYDSTGNIWDNYSYTLIEYDRFGFDSCTLYKFWNDDSIAWVNGERHIMYLNDQKAITFDVNEQWTGTEWYRYTGHKFDYFNNEFACTDSIHIFDWHTDTYDWFMKHKWFLYYDENHVQTWGRDMVFDSQLQKWRNYQQTLDYEFDNWCGCEEFWSCTLNPTHFILQNWYDTAWFNIERFNAEYDSLGGNVVIMEGHNGSDWYYWIKKDLKFISIDTIDYLLIYEWIDNNWEELSGRNSSYTYDGNKLIEINDDIWDTITDDWQPYLVIKYEDYIWLENISSIPEQDYQSENKIKITPNPSTGNVTLQLIDKRKSIKKVEIYNLKGQAVYSQKSIVTGKRIIVVDISGLEKGIYILKVVTKCNELYSAKLVKE